MGTQKNSLNEMTVLLNAQSTCQNSWVTKIFTILLTKILLVLLRNEADILGTKICKYCTCPAGRVTYNFHLSCKHMYLSFKNVCNKEHKGVICNMTSSSNSSQSTHPVG